MSSEQVEKGLSLRLTDSELGQEPGHIRVGAGHVIREFENGVTSFGSRPPRPTGCHLEGSPGVTVLCREGQRITRESR